jgi:hypothetical protein
MTPSSITSAQWHKRHRPLDHHHKNNPAHHSVMASGKEGSPQYLNRRCLCNWDTEYLNLKKLLAQAGDVLLTRMIPIKPGVSETSIALKSSIKFYFKLGPEYDDADFYLAAHHWAPSLVSRNYEGSKGNRPSRHTKNLLTRLEAAMYGCSMEERINNFESCLKRSGILISSMDTSKASPICAGAHQHII